MIRGAFAESTRATTTLRPRSQCSTAHNYVDIASRCSAAAASHHTPSLTDQPLTPPLTDKKPFAGAVRVTALLRDLQKGRNTTSDTQIEFELTEEDYRHIERILQQDEALSGYVEDKIRFVDLRHREDHS
jgi:hypothetical protein